MFARERLIAVMGERVARAIVVGRTPIPLAELGDIEFVPTSGWSVLNSLRRASIAWRTFGSGTSRCRRMTLRTCTSIRLRNESPFDFGSPDR